MNTSLADRAWFVLFDAEEDGLYGSYTFARDPSYPIRETRAMLNMDMVGVAAEPLGVAGNIEVLSLARQIHARSATAGRTDRVHRR